MVQPMKIAIVDDEKDMRQSIGQWLALSGYETETFASAEDALNASDAGDGWHAISQAFDECR